MDARLEIKRVITGGSYQPSSPRCSPPHSSCMPGTYLHSRYSPNSFTGQAVAGVVPRSAVTVKMSNRSGCRRQRLQLFPEPWERPSWDSPIPYSWMCCNVVFNEYLLSRGNFAFCNRKINKTFSCWSARQNTVCLFYAFKQFQISWVYQNVMNFDFDCFVKNFRQNNTTIEFWEIVLKSFGKLLTFLKNLVIYYSFSPERPLAPARIA